MSSASACGRSAREAAGSLGAAFVAETVVYWVKSSSLVLPAGVV
jgi:hypothetical protein